MNDLSSIKLCQDCKHFQPSDEHCTRTLYIDYVHGKHHHFGAQSERGSISQNDCGPEAKFYEPILKAVA